MNRDDIDNKFEKSWHLSFFWIFLLEKYGVVLTNMPWINCSVIPIESGYEKMKNVFTTEVTKILNRTFIKANKISV